MEEQLLIFVGAVENQKTLQEQNDLLIKGYGNLTIELPFNITNDELFNNINFYDPKTPILLFSASCSKTKDVTEHLKSIGRSLNLLYVVEPYTCNQQPAGPIVKNIIEESIQLGLPVQNIYNGGEECTGSNIIGSTKINRLNHFDSLTIIGEIIKDNVNPLEVTNDLQPVEQEIIKINKPTTPPNGVTCSRKPKKRTRPGSGIVVDETSRPFIPEDFERRTINDEISDADFWTLLSIVIRENYNTELQGFADVAQVIYNRFGVSSSGLGFYSGYSPGSPDNKITPTPNLKALILSPGQFEPAFTAPGNTEPSEPWINIKDFNTAVEAVRFNKNDPSKPRYTPEKAGELLLTAYNTLSSPIYQENAKQVIGGRTDFKAPSKYDIVDDNRYNCGSDIKCGIPSKGLSENRKEEIRNGERGHFVERKGTNVNNAFGWGFNYKGTEVYELNINWDKYKNNFPQLIT
jgi:hypothetical protein